MLSTVKRWFTRATSNDAPAPAPELWAKVEARLPFLAFLPPEALTRL